MSTPEQVRHGYVSLIQEIQDAREELIDPSNDRLPNFFQRANTLYKNVKHAREQALDSQTLTLISNAGVDRLERFRTDFKEQHEPIQFVQKLSSWLKSSSLDDRDINLEDDDDDEDGATQPVSTNGVVTQINWSELGKRVIPHVSQTPSCDFLYGLLDIPVKEKRKVTRQTKEKVAPVLVAKEGIDDANQIGKETTKHVEQIYKIVKREKKRPLYDTVINPKSFGQTVENFFYLSFLVKDGHVRINKNGTTEPILEAAEQPSKEDYASGDADRKQCVVKLDYKTWERLSKEKNLQDSYLPHRDYSSFLQETAKRRQRVISQFKKAEKKRNSSLSQEEVEPQNENENENEEEVETPTPPPRATSSRKRSQRSIPIESESDSDSDEQPRKRSRKK